MVHMTEQEIKCINGIWNKVDPKQIGAEVIDRLLIVYPLTKKFFNYINNLGSADALSHDTKVKAYGEKLVRSIGEAFKNMDNLDEYFTKLSLDLRVDPGNFVLFLEKLVDVLDKHFHKEFTPEVKGSFKKAFSAISDAYSKSYH